MGRSKCVEKGLKSEMSTTADEIIFSMYAKLDAAQPSVVRLLRLNQRIVSVFLRANESRLIDL